MHIALKTYTVQGASYPIKNLTVKSVNLYHGINSIPLRDVETFVISTHVRLLINDRVAAEIDISSYIVSVICSQTSKICRKKAAMEVALASRKIAVIFSLSSLHNTY